MASRRRNSNPRPRNGGEQHAEADISLEDEAHSTADCLMPDPEGDLSDLANGAEVVAFISTSHQISDTAPPDVSGPDTGDLDIAFALYEGKAGGPSMVSRKRAPAKQPASKHWWSPRRRK